MGTTYHGMLFCSGEVRLAGMVQRFPGFDGELEALRQDVAVGTLTPRKALNKANEPGQLAPTIQAQLKNCLGRIAAGSCPNYPKAL